MAPLRTSCVAALLIACFVLSISIFWLGVPVVYYIKNLSFVQAKGVNGTGGQNLVLECPVGRKIEINSTKPPVLSCADLSSTKPSKPACDPFLSNGLYNSSNTQNILTSMQNECEGKNSCTFSVPSLGGGVCGNSCLTSQLIGTYYCK